MEEMFGLVVIPLLIFLSRTVDVSMSTIRLIFISKGFRFLSPLIGFFEILLWLIAIQQILQNMTNVSYYIAYAGGFAFGTVVGMAIEEKISLGNVLVRIILQKDSKLLCEELNEKGFLFTKQDGTGGSKKAHVDIIFMVIEKKKLKKLIAIINRFEPTAFYSVEDLRIVHSAYSQSRKGFGLLRKGK